MISTSWEHTIFCMMMLEIPDWFCMAFPYSYTVVYIFVVIYGVIVLWRRDLPNTNSSLSATWINKIIKLSLGMIFGWSSHTKNRSTMSSKCHIWINLILNMLMTVQSLTMPKFQCHIFTRTRQNLHSRVIVEWSHWVKMASQWVFILP